MMKTGSSAGSRKTLVMTIAIRFSPIVRAAIAHSFEFEERELIECKGVGKILTSFLLKKMTGTKT